LHTKTLSKVLKTHKFGVAAPLSTSGYATAVQHGPLRHLMIELHRLIFGASIHRICNKIRYGFVCNILEIYGNRKRSFCSNFKNWQTSAASILE